ncbi:MAG: DPP IV N-terminal domain-containing protein, partial [Chloroflexi bacterium]|nr:DPP IV N-terminal domain-containing protein [Chloroflexota bacterium]
SPNGKKLLFVSERDVNPEIYTLDPNGVEQIRLTYNNDPDNQPVWSPDGDRIAFVSYLDGDGEIFIMNTKGEDQVRITNNAAQDTNPTW